MEEEPKKTNGCTVVRRPLSANNLPPFFRKLTKVHVVQLQKLAKDAKITKRHLGVYWSFNFNKDEVLRNTGVDDSVTSPTRREAPWRTNLSRRLPV